MLAFSLVLTLLLCHFRYLTRYYASLQPATVQDWKKLRVAAVNEISSVEDIREALAHDFGIPDSTGHMVVVVERLLGGEWGISRVVVRTIFDALYNLPWWYRWDRGELRTVLEAFCGDVLKALQALPKVAQYSIFLIAFSFQKFIFVSDHVSFFLSFRRPQRSPMVCPRRRMKKVLVHLRHVFYLSYILWKPKFLLLIVEIIDFIFNIGLERSL